jgi:hypothetical protein
VERAIQSVTKVGYGWRIELEKRVGGLRMKLRTKLTVFSIILIGLPSSFVAR